MARGSTLTYDDRSARLSSLYVLVVTGLDDHLHGSSTRIFIRCSSGHPLVDFSSAVCKISADRCSRSSMVIVDKIKLIQEIRRLSSSSCRNESSNGSKNSTSVNKWIDVISSILANCSGITDVNSKVWYDVRTGICYSHTDLSRIVFLDDNLLY